MSRNQTAQQLAQQLSVGLECPVCFDLLTYPIFTCVVGHMICGHCKGHINSCPLCRSDFVGTRSFYAEEVAKILAQSIQSDSLMVANPAAAAAATPKDHGAVAADNSQNPIMMRCCLSVNGCRNKLVLVGDYVDHLQGQHGVAVVTSATGVHTKKIRVSPSATPLVKRGMDRLFILNVDGKSFVINMIQDGVQVRVYALTDSKPLEKPYEVELSILDGQNEKGISWKGPINKLQTSDDALLHTRNYLDATARYIKSVIQEDEVGKYWTLMVEIKRPQLISFNRLTDQLSRIPSNVASTFLHCFYGGIFFMIGYYGVRMYN